VAFLDLDAVMTMDPFLLTELPSYKEMGEYTFVFWIDGSQRWPVA
jgi:hypothetical protein